MRIAYVISTLKRCGPVNVLYDIVANLGPDCEAGVFTLATEPNDSRLDDFEAIGVSTTCVVRTRLQSMLVGEIMLEKALARFRPEVIHAHGFRATRLCRRLPYPSVVTVHSCIHEDFKMAYGRFQARFMTKSQVAALRSYDEIIACSESNAEYLRREYGLKVSAIRNGVNQRIYRPLGLQERIELRSELGIDDHCTVYVSSGGCSEGKNTLSLATAFSEVFPGDSRVKLHVLGDGPTYDECCALKAHNVLFHGFVGNVLPWLQASDIFVSASHSEGMPLAVLEAVSCGLPLLISDIPSHREVGDVLIGQDCVQFFDAQNEGAIELALRRSLIAGSKQPNDASCFSATLMAQKYEAVYKDLVQEGQE